MQCDENVLMGIEVELECCSLLGFSPGPACVIKTISPSYCNSVIDKLVLLCTMNYATTDLTIH